MTITTKKDNNNNNNNNNSNNDNNNNDNCRPIYAEEIAQDWQVAKLASQPVLRSSWA